MGGLALVHLAETFVEVIVQLSDKIHRLTESDGRRRRFVYNP